MTRSIGYQPRIHKWGPTRQGSEALCAFNPHNKYPPVEVKGESLSGGLVKAP